MGSTRRERGGGVLAALGLEQRWGRDEHLVGATGQRSVRLCDRLAVHARVGGVVVNMLIDRAQVEESSPEFVKNRLVMQDRYMDDIREKFNGMVRATVPLYETEVRGTTSMGRMGQALFV